MAKCHHKWQKVDKDDTFTKEGQYLVQRVKEECVRCGDDRVRNIKRRLK